MEFLDQCSNIFIKLIAYGILLAMGLGFLAMFLTIVLQGICDVCGVVSFIWKLVGKIFTTLYRALRYCFTVLRQVYRTRAS